MEHGDQLLKTLPHSFEQLIRNWTKCGEPALYGRGAVDLTTKTRRRIPGALVLRLMAKR
jgi:hypothetical protein